MIGMLPEKFGKAGEVRDGASRVSGDRHVDYRLERGIRMAA
jgi:hypothetical protein